MPITDKVIGTNKGYSVTFFKVDGVALDNINQTVKITGSGYINADVAGDAANSVYGLEAEATAQQDPQLYNAVVAYAEAKLAAKIDEIIGE